MLKIVKGEEHTTSCGWVRRDFVENDGVRLDGFIQLRKRRNKTYAVTVYGKLHKIGIHIDWLAEKNGVSP